QNHDIALTALESFDGVDGDTSTCEHLSQQYDLRAKRRDDTDGFGPNSAVNKRLHKIEHDTRFVRIRTPIPRAFDRNEHHRCGVLAVRRSSILRANTGFQFSVIEKTIRDIHDLRMHAVLRLEQRYCCCLTLEPLEHRMREST